MNSGLPYHVPNVSSNLSYDPWMTDDDNLELDNLFDHQDKFPVSTRVQAIYSEDGEWKQHGGESGIADEKVVESKAIDFFEIW
ncbi:hypothetical protein QL285_079697 [Trifolium repens]|nr:hypothetical protein QL285_079697 [Trifolium repens]